MNEDRQPQPHGWTRDDELYIGTLVLYTENQQGKIVYSSRLINEHFPTRVLWESDRSFEPYGLIDLADRLMGFRKSTVSGHLLGLVECGHSADMDDAWRKFYDDYLKSRIKGHDSVVIACESSELRDILHQRVTSIKNDQIPDQLSSDTLVRLDNLERSQAALAEVRGYIGWLIANGFR